MADWFKLHENWFTEPRLQWAIREQQTVLTVWLWCLTECCRIGSDTIGLHQEDFEMIGIQQLLNISPGLFTSGISLLERIRYIQTDRTKNTIKVVKWSEFQSEYLSRKNKGDYDEKPAKRTKTPIISVNIGDSPTEERRLEEKRRDTFKEPTKEEVEEYAKSIEFKVDGEYFLAHYRKTGWKIKGTQIKDWKSCVVTWKKNNLKVNSNSSPEKDVRRDLIEYQAGGKK